MPAIKDGHNPATWMLEVSSAGSAAQLGVDFADVYAASPLAKCVCCCDCLVHAYTRAHCRRMRGEPPGQVRSLRIVLHVMYVCCFLFVAAGTALSPAHATPRARASPGKTRRSWTSWPSPGPAAPRWRLSIPGRPASPRSSWCVCMRAHTLTHARAFICGALRSETRSDVSMKDHERQNACVVWWR